MLETLGTKYPGYAAKLQNAIKNLKCVSDFMKQEEDAYFVANPTELLDALCDQIVTATGVGTFLGMNVPGGLAEVNRSNYSKFVDGQPVFDENKKVMKGPDYTKPNLKPFI